MAAYGYPNKIRAYTALLIYYDAMKPYIADELEDHIGPDWLDEAVLNDYTEKNNQHSYNARGRAREDGTPDYLLIENNQIPNLLRWWKQRGAFKELGGVEISKSDTVRNLRNEILEHDYKGGDCTPNESQQIIDLCSEVLEACDQFDDAEVIQRLSEDDEPRRRSSWRGSEDDRYDEPTRRSSRRGSEDDRYDEPTRRSSRRGSEDDSRW